MVNEIEGASVVNDTAKRFGSVCSPMTSEYYASIQLRWKALESGARVKTNRLYSFESVSSN